MIPVTCEASKSRWSEGRGLLLALTGDCKMNNVCSFNRILVFHLFAFLEFGRLYQALFVLECSNVCCMTVKSSELTIVEVPCTVPGLGQCSISVSLSLEEQSSPSEVAGGPSGTVMTGSGTGHYE